ncbi:MAG: hypothetical protein ACFFCO_09945 [Promethearchaeota archaeon]
MSKANFIIGAVGMLMLTIIVPVMMAMSFFDIYYYLPGLSTVFAIVLAVSILLGGFAFLGFRNSYDSTVGLVAFILSLIFPWFLLAANLISFLIFITWAYYLLGIWAIMALLGVILVGILFILWGVSFIMSREDTGNSGLAIAAGVLWILVGAFFCAYILEFIGDILIIPAGIVAMILLFMANTNGT